MKLSHNFINGQYAEIIPTLDKNFPRHSAILFIKNEGRQGYQFAKMLLSQQEGIDYCRVYNYSIPFGF